MGCVLLASIAAQAQTTSTWTGASNTTWSNAGNWSNGVPGATGGAATTDVANIANLAAAATITYDAGASGFLGALNLTQTANSVVTTFGLGRDLTLESGVSSIYTTGSLGSVVLALNGHTLDVGTGATFTYGGATVVNPKINVAYVGGSGALVIDGTFLATESASSTGIFASNIGSATTVDSTGVFALNTASSSGTRVTINGNFTTLGNATIQSLGITNGNQIFFSGASNSFSGGTVFSGVAPGTFVFAAGVGGQTTATAALLPGFLVRDVNAGTTSQVVTTETFSSTATSGAIGNAVSGITLVNGSNMATSIFKLGSNLNLASGSTPFTVTWNGVAPSSLTSAVQNVDLNGFTYDATTATTAVFAPSGTGTGGATHVQFNLVNSGASSIAGGNGIFRAGLFVLDSGTNPLDIGVGAGVILQATLGGNNLNDLSGITGGVTTIDPTSTFYATGAGTGASPTRLASNRSIGNITVGDGTNATVLTTAGTPITALGIATVNANSTLDVHSSSFLTAAGLVGVGTVTNFSGSGASQFTIVPTGSNVYAFSGSITDASASTPLSLVLGGGATGKQILSGTNSYRGTTTVSGGTLLVTGVSSGGGAIAVNGGGAFGGAGGTVTSSGVAVASGGGLSVSGAGTVAAGTLTLALGGGALDLSAAMVQAGELNFVLGSNAGLSDKIVLSSAGSLLNIGGGLLSLADFTFEAGSTFGAGTYVLFDTHSAAGISGSLAAAGLTGTLDGLGIVLSQSVDGSGFQDIILTATAVPEPSPALLLPLAGGAALLFRRRRAGAGAPLS